MFLPAMQMHGFVEIGIVVRLIAYRAESAPKHLIAQQLSRLRHRLRKIAHRLVMLIHGPVVNGVLARLQGHKLGVVEKPLTVLA